MKKIFILSCLMLCSISHLNAQKVLSDDVNDTLSVDKLGTKIEFENNSDLAEKWNLEIVNTAKRRKVLKNISTPIRLYYENAYLSALLNQGYFVAEKGNIKQEIELYYEVIRSANIKNHAKVLGFTYNSIGAAFTKAKEYQKGLINFNKALKIAVQLNDKNLESIILGSIAFTYRKLGDLTKSLEFNFKNLALSKEVNNPNYIAVSLTRIALIYKDKKEYDKALNFFKQSLVESNKLNNEQQIAEINLHLHDIYVAQNKSALAQQSLIIAHEVATKSKYMGLLQKTGVKIYKIYQNLGNYPKALEALELAMSSKDSLNKEENKNAVLKAEFKYETELKEAQIKSLAQQKQISELESKRKNTLIYGILGAILALSAIAYFSFTKFKEKKANELLSSQLEEAERRIEIEQKATESELKALKSQMNPHFMFNALNSIQEQFMYGDKTVANEQMGNFTYLTRQILTVSGKKKINLSTEVEILTKYLDLEKMRFAEGFEYAINLSSTIDEDYHQIPPMLIQPFVENSIKHGLLHKQGEKKLKIYFDLDEAEENLLCTVEDNGVGREKSTEIKSKRVQQHESFSTSATEERLRLLGNGLNNKDLVVYEDLRNGQGEGIGTRVRIKIPLG
ncbi:MAG: histidine kinase [Arcicella sp.]|nr:histidine kinase [Arcicella sp.]